MRSVGSSSSFVPLVADPGGLGSARYLHVIGSTVWEHDELVVGDWDVHFLGVLDGAAVWAVDVPHGADPADGAAVDLYRYFAVADEVRWSLAGRAVQIVEWARTHRYCGRCATPT